eukprot:180454_1
MNNCIFINNIEHSHMFTVKNSSLHLHQIQFISNIADLSNSIIYIEAQFGASSVINMSDCLFDRNSAYALIYDNQSSAIHIVNTTFQNSIYNSYDYFSMKNNNLTITNSQFVNGTSRSLMIATDQQVYIRNTIWDNYTAPTIITKIARADGSIYFDSITMRNIHGNAIYIEKTRGLINLSNSQFDSISTNNSLHGAIVLENVGMINIESVLFTHCNTNQGPLVIDTSRAFVNNCFFNDNIASADAGSAITIKNIHQLINEPISGNYELININNCTFQNNKGDLNGALFIPITNDTFLSSVITKNSFK